MKGTQTVFAWHCRRGTAVWLGLGRLAAGVAARWRLGQWYAQLDLDVPAGDLDVVDGQPEQLLFPGVVEVVDDGADAGGEVLDAAAELVVLGQAGALGRESVALAGAGFRPGGRGRGGGALVPAPQGTPLTRPGSSQAAGGARRGLHLVLSALALPAASNVSSLISGGQGIAIHSEGGRGTCRVRRPGRLSGTVSVRL